MSAWGRSTKHKYGAERAKASRLTDGYSFASQLEKNVYLYLKAMQQKGEVEILKVQTRVFLSGIDYRPDFKILDIARNEEVYVEAKGFETAAWRIKRKLWIEVGPAELWIFKGKGARVYRHEVLRPKKQGCAGF